MCRVVFFETNSGVDVQSDDLQDVNEIVKKYYSVSSFWFLPFKACIAFAMLILKVRALDLRNPGFRASKLPLDIYASRCLHADLLS